MTPVYCKDCGEDIGQVGIECDACAEARHDHEEWLNSPEGIEELFSD